jgi:hypothetical protein
MINIHKDYDIRFAREDDIQNIQKFIEKNWLSGHALATSKELFSWQFSSLDNNELNFIIGVDKKTNDVGSILGYIPTSHYDKILKEKKQCWLVMWMTKESLLPTGLGAFLMLYLQSKLKYKSYVGIGLSKGVIPIYKKLGFQMGTMDHYYMINKRLESFRLLEVGNDSPLTAALKFENISINYIKNQQQKELRDFFSRYDFDGFPCKSYDYILNRYFDHPHYNYNIYVTFDGSIPQTLIVTRTVTHNDSSACKIVELLCANQQNSYSGLGTLAQHLFETTSIEFIDFYGQGYNNKSIEQQGFLARLPNSKTIIPHYFEPFCLKNIDIIWAYKGVTEKNILFTRGDSDQDRPTRV